jgi:hypothetical protein
MNTLFFFRNSLTDRSNLNCGDCYLINLCLWCMVNQMFTLSVYLIFPWSYLWGLLVCVDEQSEICFSLSKWGDSLNNLCTFTLQFSGFYMSLCTIDLILESTVERFLWRSGMHKNLSMLCRCHWREERKEGEVVQIWWLQFNSPQACSLGFKHGCIAIKLVELILRSRVPWFDQSVWGSTE